jgi:tol-pal system protein YbgF
MSPPLTVVAMMAILVVTGCASRGAVQQAVDDIDVLRADLADLRQAQEAIAAEMTQRLDESRALEARAMSLESGLRESLEEITRLRSRLQATEDELRQVRTVATVPARAPAPPAVAPERAPRIVPRTDAAEQIYSKAFSAFRAREYGQAVLDFLDFIAKFPGHPLTANAQYWIAEAYYVQRDYRQAMTEFRKVIDMYPSSPKAPDALIKVGLCYDSLRDPTRARQTWQRVVTTYPSTEAAAIAKTLMRGRTTTRR